MDTILGLKHVTRYKVQLKQIFTLKAKEWLILESDNRGSQPFGWLAPRWRMSGADGPKTGR